MIIKGNIFMIHQTELKNLTVQKGLIISFNQEGTILVECTTSKVTYNCFVIRNSEKQDTVH